MLFYRQKILLALLEALGGELPATDFQKYLFLFTKLCEKEKSYDFVPYRFGCYSFQATADKNKLIGKGYLKDSSGWEISKVNLNYTRVLNKGDDKKINLFVSQYRSIKGKELIQHVYKNYPYYAINSEIAEDNLDAMELEKVNKLRPLKSDKFTFATIGYEGGSVETYLNRLIKNDIRVLVDVRKNSISRKYGFSKNTLSSLLKKVGIEYAHIPDLGIPSSDRKELKTQLDYDRLFDKYEKTVLKNHTEALDHLYAIYKNSKRVAITCFEKEHDQCHRSRVATAIELMSDGEVTAQHL